jgi:hypothetical protein
VNGAAFSPPWSGAWADGGAFQRLFAVWEKSAAAMADGAARHPKVLELGAGLMRAHLAWVRAMQATVEAWAPLLQPEVKE